MGKAGWDSAEDDSGGSCNVRKLSAVEMLCPHLGWPGLSLDKQAEEDLVVHASSITLSSTEKFIE